MNNWMYQSIDIDPIIIVKQVNITALARALLNCNSSNVSMAYVRRLHVSMAFAVVRRHRMAMMGKSSVLRQSMVIDFKDKG